VLNSVSKCIVELNVPHAIWFISYFFLPPDCITRGVADGYVGFSHYSYLYLHIFPINTLQHFNISLCLLINIIISGLNNIVRVMRLPWYYQFYLLYFCNIARWWPKYFMYIRNKRMLEHICSCMCLIIKEDIYWIHTTG